MNLVVADGWCLVAVTKTAGSSTPRFHRYKYSTSTWTHEDGTGALANTAGTATQVRIGDYEGVDDFDGKMAVVGYFDTALSDSVIETLDADLQSWRLPQLNALWPLNQASEATDVVDMAGHANETSITGTTAVTGDDPTFDFDFIRPISYRAQTDPSTTGGQADPAAAISLPSGTVSGDMVGLFFWMKYSGTTLTAPTNWQDPTDNETTGGAGASGVDSGVGRLVAFFREYDGAWSMPTIDLSATPNVTLMGAISYSKDSAAAWQPVVTASASDTSASTTVFDPPASSTVLNLDGGDIIGAVVGQNTDAGSGMPTSPTLTAAGATILTPRVKINVSTITGQDSRILTYESKVSHGETTAGPDTTFSYTGGAANQAGAVVFYRLRAVHPDNAVRSFDKFDDELRVAVDAASAMTYGTIAALVKVDGTGWRTIAGLHTSGGTLRSSLYVLDTDEISWYNGTSDSVGPAIPQRVWQLIVARRSSGTDTPRFSIYDYETEAWTHGDGDTAQAAWTSPGASGTIRHMNEGQPDRFSGSMAARAIWVNDMPWAADSGGDAAIEAEGLELALQAWGDAAPDHLWEYHQTAVATDLLDLIGNADETSITGTEITDDRPPGFEWGYSSITDTELVVQNAEHGHSAGSPTLTQAHSLVVANAQHTHTAASPTLTQAHTLVVANAQHTHTAASPTLTQAHTLVVQNAEHGHSAGSPTLTQAHTLVVANATHTQTAASPTLTQAHTLVVQNAEHGHSAGSPTLVENRTLAIQNAEHGHTAASPTLTQAHTLAVANAQHGHTAASPALTQAHTLVVANATHTHQSPNVDITTSGAVYVRRFTKADDDFMDMLPDAFTGLGGSGVDAATAFLWKPISNHAGGLLYIDWTTGGVTAFNPYSDTNVWGDWGSGATQHIYDYSDNFVDIGPRWMFVLMVHEAASQPARVHVYDYDNESWSHTDSAGFPGTGGGGGAVLVRIGQYDHTAEHLDAEMAAMGYWSDDLPVSLGSAGDSEIEALDLHLSLQAWLDTDPVALWGFNQENVGDGVLDLTGNGSDEDTITGTSVVESEDLTPNFFDVGEPTDTELVVANAEHGHTAGSPTLTQAHTLAVANAEHGHSAGSPTLTQAHTLVVSNAQHGHTAQSPTLTQAHTLVVANAQHGHTAENVVLVLGDDETALKRWNGTVFVEGGTLRRWNGTTFVSGGTLRRWNGSSFIPPP